MIEEYLKLNGSDSLERTLAKLEIGWWIAHHRGDFDAAKQYMSKEYQKQFNCTQEQADACVDLRIQAAKEHDIAEKLEDKGEQEKADIHWNNALELLEKHFVKLYDL